MAITDPSLVLLIGPSGSGKSTFAERHFPAGSVISSDELRAMVAGDPNDQAASGEAFRLLAIIVEGRLRRRLMTAVDATNLRRDSRRRWLRMAADHRLDAVAICFDFPLELYLEHNRSRPGRQVEDDVVRQQAARMRTAMADLAGEAYGAIHVLRSPGEVARVSVELVTADVARWDLGPGGR
jgi:predicted kinase